MKSILASATIVTCVTAAYLLSSPREAPPLRPMAGDAGAGTDGERSANPAAPHVAPQNQTLISPFSSGAPTMRTGAQRIAARRAAMKDMGIATPEEYFHMPLSELQSRANKRDIMAMLQLVAQLEGEHDELQADPTYDFSGSASNLKKRFLADAADNGHIHSAVLLAQQHWKDQQPAEALAWALYAQRSGYAEGRRWAEQTLVGIAPADRQAAETRAEELIQLAMLRQSMAAAARR